MPGWVLAESHPTQGRTFQRPLDPTECCFLWHGLTDGITDLTEHFQLRLLHNSRDAHLFSDVNITRAWLSTKRRYPLAGAIVRGASGPLYGDGGDIPLGSEPHFIVQERSLSALRPEEIVFGKVATADEARRRMIAMLNGPRGLSDRLLSRLYVFRETGSEGADVLHLMPLLAHCVMDRTSSITFVRCLLDTLARGGGSDSEPPQIPLEDRLAMEIASMDLEPAHLRSFSPAKRRWRRVVGMVILQLRMERRRGGHTLPCQLSRLAAYTTTQTKQVATLLTPVQSATVIANCRTHHVTFGSASVPLAQVAMTRVLYRRYLRGEITKEEWAYRRKQPYLTGSLLNLRPYLDKAWFERGGGGELMLSITFPFYQLPFMTLGAAAERHPSRISNHDPGRVLSDGTPPFPELLTFNRFLHRARSIKKQTVAFINHPLFFEIVHAARLAEVKHIRRCALKWLRQGETANDNGTQGSPEDPTDLDVPVILAHGGSTLGSVDLGLILPSKYPLAPTHPLSPYSTVPHPMKAGYIPSLSTSALDPADTTHKVEIEYYDSRLRARPGELYLGSVNKGGQVIMHAFYDGSMYEEDVVREWLDEVRDAVLWYLGETGGNVGCEVKLEQGVHWQARL